MTRRCKFTVERAPWRWRPLCFAFRAAGCWCWIGFGLVVWVERPRQ